MALRNYFTADTPTQDTQGVPQEWAIRGSGVDVNFMCKTQSFAAADSNGSTYVLFRKIPATAIIADLLLEVDAMAGDTSAKIGLFDSDTGAAIVDNCFCNAIDIHLGSTKLAPIDGAAALTHDNTLQRLLDLAGETLLKNRGRYDIVMTRTTAGGAAGLVTARARLIPSG